MKNFISKVSIALFSLFALQLVFSCCQEKEFYDFTKMEIEFEDTQITPDEKFFLSLRATDFHYVDYSLPNFGFASTFAYTCDNIFMKFPFTAFHITSDAEFDATHQAGADLTKFFLAQVVQQSTYFIKADKLSEELPDGLEGDHLAFKIRKTPSRNKTHQFTLILTKSNGATITIKTSPIT